MTASPTAAGLRTVRSVAELRAALAPVRAAGRTVGLVPTMGAFHAGHHALMRRARAENDVVVVSLFVNPTQFNEASDLDAYPRDEAADAREAAELGVDLLFAPPVEAVYPAGFATTVAVSDVAERYEGAVRGPAHFAGVATVVLKLLNMAAPDAAYFGQKDAQQAAVIRRMVADLDVGVRIATVPTVREPDGLAMSSRNVHLQGADRQRAVALRRGLDAARAQATAGERDAGRLAAAAAAAMAELDVEPEYVAVVDPDSFAPLERVEHTALVALAARVGGTRLIDNDLIHLDGRP